METAKKWWPHAPSRRVSSQGAYFVTAKTYDGIHFFHGRERLVLLERTLLEVLHDHGWEVQQWAVFPNHYHFVGLSPVEGPTFKKTLGKVHTLTSIAANRLDGAVGRKVWYSFRDTQLTFQKSYLARLNYVRCNAVHHGLVKSPEDYEYCSARWFQERAERSLFETVSNFPIDRLSVEDVDLY